MSPAVTASTESVGVTLGEIAATLAGLDPSVRGDPTVRVTDVCQDSRAIRGGELFVGRVGAATSGVQHAREAISRGAAAVLVERGAAATGVEAPVVEVSDARRALALAAHAVHGRPTESLEVVGVTGTNGKTTVSWLLQAALEGAGGRAARLGTLGYALGDDRTDSPLTTPEADVVARHAARARDAGATHLVLEASSHALSQARLDGVRFAAAAFTNLSQDHLDYHGSMSEYGAAKERLFTDLAPRAAAINVDDPFGRALVAKCRCPVMRVSTRSDADVWPRRVAADAGGIRALFRTPTAEVQIDSRLVGGHNVENLALALATCAALEVDVVRAGAALARAPSVPGRLERCDEPADGGVVVLVDYAHTPDALARSLDSCRELARGKVLCVFGCGGDRDADKRAKMGAVVAERADHAIVTNDNPRSEEPRAIAGAIESGFSGRSAAYVVELDRAAAIEQAITRANAGDVVLIAGKGHEPYQILGSKVIAFDDREQARRALRLRRNRSGR